MNLEKKLAIVDEYIKDIKQYLHYGLEEGRANGSEGEDLMEHFKIMAECFKEMVSLEDEFGIDLVTLFKALKDGIWFIDEYKRVKGKYKPDINNKGLTLSVDYEFQYELSFMDYGKTWALTMDELL